MTNVHFLFLFPSGMSDNSACFCLIRPNLPSENLNFHNKTLIRYESKGTSKSWLSSLPPPLPLPPPPPVPIYSPPFHTCMGQIELTEAVFLQLDVLSVANSHLFWKSYIFYVAQVHRHKLTHSHMDIYKLVYMYTKLYHGK